MTVMHWQIPGWMLDPISQVANDKPVALLLRHSVRGPIPSTEVGNSVPITEEGERLARALGELLQARIRSLHSSPVLRCLQTAECLQSGAGTNLTILKDPLLGEPGVFVADGELAWSNWQTLGHEGVVMHLVSSNEVLPGMVRPDLAAQTLLKHILQRMEQESGLHVFVTHDIVVLVTVARLLKKKYTMDAWPRFLEGAFLSRDHSGVRIAYRDEEGLVTVVDQQV